MIAWSKPGQWYMGRYVGTMTVRAGEAAPLKVLVLEQPNGVEVQLPLTPKLEESFLEIQPRTLVRVVYQGKVRTREGIQRQTFKVVADDRLR
jgi:hypothetical protein